MSDVLNPERPGTTYQIRQVIEKIAVAKDLTLWEAAEKVKVLEFEDPDSLQKLCEKFDAEPED